VCQTGADQHSIAQARTGTGKTLGFLIPVIQRIVQADPKLAEKVRGYKRARADDIRAIVISPTRELAEQIAVEAKKVTSGTGLVVQTAVGGTMKRAMLQKTLREGCHLLIGTPGRLNDILSDPYSGIKCPNLNALVMDEADRLLDEGFTKEIQQIKEYLPDPEVTERQNLMFSATVPREVVTLVRQTLRLASTLPSASARMKSPPTRECRRSTSTLPASRMSFPRSMSSSSANSRPPSLVLVVPSRPSCTSTAQLKSPSPLLSSTSSAVALSATPP
jgi:superfamily II DNA/RNA helicase